MKSKWPEIGHSNVAIKRLKKDITKEARNRELKGVSLVPKGRGLVSIHLVKAFGIILICLTYHM